MYPRTNYEMTEADLAKILDACRPVPAMMLGGYVPDQQANANRAWAELGERMGFDPMTVQPAAGKGERYFTAIPSETPEVREARLAREGEERRRAEVIALEEEIAAKQKRLAQLRAERPEPPSERDGSDA